MSMGGTGTDRDGFGPLGFSPLDTVTVDRFGFTPEGDCDEGQYKNLREGGFVPLAPDGKPYPNYFDQTNFLPLVAPCKKSPHLLAPYGFGGSYYATNFIVTVVNKSFRKIKS